MRKLALAALLAALALAPALAGSYSIDLYSATVDVGLDNVWSVEETIDADFHTPLHGIFREIPVGYLDGRRAVVSDLRASEPCEVYEEGREYLRLRFGSADRTLTGPHSYVLSYRYDIGADTADGYDEFYCNLVGEGWQETLQSCRFTIRFPKPIDTSKVWLNRGSYGAVSSLDVYWSFPDDRTVEVAAEAMAPGEELTIRVELPEGYFVGARRAVNWTGPLFALTAAGSILAVGLAALVWHRNGRDKVPVFAALPSPPPAMTPMQMGYLADYSVDDKDITSMLFFWADKGLLRIDEKRRGSFVFTRTGALPAGALPMERNLFDWFFACGTDGVVREKDLRSGFYEKTQRTKAAIEGYYKGPRELTEPKSRRMQVLCLLLGLVPLAAAALLLTWDDLGGATILAGVLGAGLLAAQSALFVLLSNRWHTVRGPKWLLAVLCCAPSIAAVWLLVSIHNAFGLLALRTTGAVLAVVAEGLVCFFAAITRKRSAYGQKTLEDVLGYREFLQKVEMDRLRMMVDDDPALFYHNLSYAIVLGLEDQWAAKFKGLVQEPPSWYVGRGRMMDALFFSSMARNLNTQIAQAVMPRSSSSRSPGLRVGGSSFGGGGFSGGGFGGGGGGAW